MYTCLIKSIRSYLINFHDFYLLVIARRTHFIHMYQQNKSVVSKVNFREASNYCKGVKESAELSHANKTRDSVLSQNVFLRLMIWTALSLELVVFFFLSSSFSCNLLSCSGCSALYKLKSQLLKLNSSTFWVTFLNNLARSI